MNSDPGDLKNKKCRPCESGMLPLAPDQVRALLAKLPGWELADNELVRVYSFKNYYQTVSFVNAVAWLAHREDHHPDLSFGYKTCTVRYSTHAVGGLSENDFICAAKVDALLV
jgi:4a-hydroxytetrahydrobiopterin dehydratase